MLLELIFLAIIQGITEFLPVSSSGHLNVLAHFIAFDQQHLLLYFLVLHAGTACAAIYFFRQDIYAIILGLWEFVTKKDTEQAKNAIKWVQLIIMVSIPTGIVGITLKTSVEALGSNLLVISIAWIVTAIILFATKFVVSKKLELMTFTYKDAFLVGIASWYFKIWIYYCHGIILRSKSFFCRKAFFFSFFCRYFWSFVVRNIRLYKSW